MNKTELNSYNVKYLSTFHLISLIFKNMQDIKKK